MKLPRYLQFALLITGALVLYSLVDDAPDGVEEIAVVQRPAHVDSNRLTPVSELKPQDGFIDIFPSGIKPADVQTSREVLATPKDAEPPKIVTPPLPFRLVGAWWSDNQRALMLQQADQQWIICRRCRAPERVWTGMNLTKDWQLKSVSAQSLTFIWLPQMREQHMALGDMDAEPTFSGLNNTHHAK
jgi:hypothetical protein